MIVCDVRTLSLSFEVLDLKRERGKLPRKEARMEGGGLRNHFVRLLFQKMLRIELTDELVSSVKMLIYSGE